MPVATRTPMSTIMSTIMGTVMSTDGAARLTLFAWLSPAFPVGGFAFSHGLEWAMEAGDAADAGALERWLGDLLRHGAPRADGVLLAAVWRAPDEIAAINELALALAPSSERRLETAAQGTAFLAAVAAAWPVPGLASFARFFAGRDLAYPVAVGFAAAAHAVPLRATLELFAQAMVGNLVSAALRLGAIGQSEGQAIVARLAPAVLDLATWAEHATLDDIGTCAWRSDIAAMRHETQYSRLFRS